MLALVVLFTLIAASILILCFKCNAVAKKIAMAAHVLALAVTLVILVQAASEPLSLVIGAEPWNIYVLVTRLDAFIMCLFIGINILITWASLSMMERDLEAARVRVHYALVCALVASLCGIVIFESFFNVFLMVEISTFLATGIVIIKKKPENMRAGMKYLTLSILGSTFILMGIIILYFQVGYFSMTGINSNLELIAGYEHIVRNALIFVTLGIALKSALFPLHIWLPDAHSTAPAASSAILSGLVLKAYIFLYIKILYKVIGADNLIHPDLQLILTVVMITGVVAMLAGSIMALLQKDIKRMIAYSSVAQIGYIFIGIGIGTQLGLFAALFHIMVHAVVKPVLFLCAGSIISVTNNRSVDQMVGIGLKMPKTMTLFTMGALSMVGIPLFVGFNSKWFFATSMIDSDMLWLLGTLAVSSLLNACYFLPLVFRAFAGSNEKVTCVERPVRELVPIFVLGSLIILLALFGGFINSYIHAGIAEIWR